MAIKLLIGGSPCTFWSIAKNSGRETEAEGMGWELFKNYLIAKEKFKPDYFLYENNKSAAQAIKDQIAEEFGVGVDPNVRFTYINSALVSAQNRQRFYVTNFGDIEQPEDRGILLKDILEKGQPRYEKAPCLDASYYKGGNLSNLNKQSGARLQVAESVIFQHPHGFNKGGAHPQHTLSKGVRSMVAETVYIGEVPEHNGTYYTGKRPSQQYRVYDTNAKGVAVTTSAITNVAEPVKLGNTNVEHLLRPYGSSAKIVDDETEKAPTLLAAMGTGGGNGIYLAEPVEIDERKINRLGGLYNQVTRWGIYDENGLAPTLTAAMGMGGGHVPMLVESVEMIPPCGQRGQDTSHTIKAQYNNTAIANVVTNGGYAATGVAEQVKVGALPNSNGEPSTSQSMQVYSTEGKSTTQMAGGGGLGGKTGLYAVPIDDNVGYATPCEWDEKGIPTKAKSCADGKVYTVYEVIDGQITIKGKQYPIKLQNGYYIIRKLTVTECARLQTMPDNYCKAVSDSQAYKGLGNGWTAEVIIHLLNHALKDVPRDEEIVVLSMYDGIGTGRYCLDKMGFTNVTYHAYEIDKYPIMIAMDNYPDIIQHGDAFAVREDDWKAPQTKAEWLDDLLAC